ncbi:hypothetical protein [Nocardia yamanashiensis]|uniref:hypothetical protein n=1 Tax=Nocardia yamanashiensis TaxID=209247 RepID=UPI00082D2FC6|nr:hypothetical protein [Nocardia yamanashiensis]
MPKYTPCPGTGRKPKDIVFHPSRLEGRSYTQAWTYGKCPVCGYEVGAKGNAKSTLKVNRHKQR